MAVCDICFGNGFICVDGRTDPCPECWGTGVVDGEDEGKDEEGEEDFD